MRKMFEGKDVNLLPVFVNECNAEATSIYVAAFAALTESHAITDTECSIATLAFNWVPHALRLPVYVYALRLFELTGIGSVPRPDCNRVSSLQISTSYPVDYAAEQLHLHTECKA